MGDYRGNDNYNGNIGGNYGGTTDYNNTAGGNYGGASTNNYGSTADYNNYGTTQNNYGTAPSNFNSTNYTSGSVNPYGSNITYQSSPKGFYFKMPRLKPIIIMAIVIVVVAFLVRANNRSQAARQAEQALMSAQCDMIQYPHAYSIDDVADILNEMIEDNAEDFYMEVETTVPKDEISSVADRIDPFLGRLSMYSYSEKAIQYGDDGEQIPDATAAVNFTFEKSIESYVYDDIKKGIPIPDDNIEAEKVKVECETFLRDNIKPGMTDYDKEVAVHDYIVNNCTYDKSNLDDMTIYSSYGVLVNRKAVCEGYARTTALLLKLSGVEVELISGDAKGDMSGGSDMGHMWNQVCIDGVWYQYDATWDDPSGDSDVIAHLYLNVSDQILSLDHEWDQSKYHTCSSMAENYYNKQGMYFSDDASFQEYVKNQLASGERDCIKCSISNIDLSEDTMSFIFSYDGISSYQFMTIGIDGYQYLEIRLNV